MQSDQYKRELAQLIKDVGGIRKDIANAQSDASKARAEASKKRAQALKATSQSSRDMYSRNAEAEDKKLIASQRRLALLQDRLATNADRQRSKEQSLRTAEKNEQAALDRASEARRRREKSDQDARDRQDARRRKVEKDHATDVARISRPTVRHVFMREPEPEKLRVLYLTASPLIDGMEPLRVDAEVNGILRVLRGVKHRDLIDLQHRPAATLEDLLNGLNDHRPHIVHFSGHAGGGLLFDNASVTEPGDHLVGYGTVARLLASTDQKPKLIVLNACGTLEGANEMLTAAPIVIAMSDLVSDAAGAVFARHFYAGLGAAQTITHAVNQAREMTLNALPEEADLVTVCAGEGFDPDDIRLVRPLA